ncbi:MAG: ABC transporter ATP-binding protein [Chthoniobacterales bacterium]
MASIALKKVRGKAIETTVDLVAGDRELVVLTGPQRSGLSAIVRLIAGLEEISEGEILFDDRRIDNVPAKDRDVAFVAHDYVPYPGVTVFENLAIGLRRKNFAANEIRKRIGSVAAALGLEAQLKTNAQSLSVEQRRFLALARAMVRQPKVYLFDQPFAGLEPAAARRGRAELVKLYTRSSATIVYATTDPAEVLALGERTVVLIDGAVQQDGQAQSIYDAPANLTVAKFFGDPPMNLVSGTLKQERNALVFSETGDGTMAIPLVSDRYSEAKDFIGKPVVLGFHPESVEIGAEPGFRALIERVEMRGFEADLYLQTGAHALIARTLRRGDQARDGHRVQCGITLEKVHLFDPETGRRVTRE